MKQKMKFFIYMIIIFILLGSINTVAAVPDSYTDLKNSWASEQIKDLLNLGIISGYDDKTIRPENLITRAEFSKMIVNSMEISVDENMVEQFKDVKKDSWCYNYVMTLKKLAIIDGYDDGTFRPENNISRAEMISMIVRVSRRNLNLNYPAHIYKDITINHWSYWNVNIASRAGIIADEDINLKPDERVTRAEVAYSIDKMLWNQKSSGIDNQQAANLTKSYTDSLTEKYNSLQSDISDLDKLSYGNQIQSLKALSSKLDLYKRLGFKYERTLSISNFKVLSQTNTLAKLSYDYDLNSKLYTASNQYLTTEQGVLTYYLKRSDNNNWVIYWQDMDKTEKPSGKLNVVWDYVGKPVDYFKGGKIDGLDVLAPTWFNISDSTGNIESRASKKYVTWAHDNNYKVWGLVTNQFDPGLTSQLLNNPLARKRLIENLVNAATEYRMDGINIDFENIKKTDKDIFTQFIKELSIALKLKGKTLSVDVTVKTPNSSWSECYDRASIARYADYVAVMTYDQHWSTSPVSGSVAQLTWVENSVKNLLSEVPSEKLLLGLPFYTREWKESPTSSGVAVTSVALSMDDAQRKIIENNAVKVWDAESGQYYAEYKKDGATYKIWLEDSKSIDLKSKLVNKYNLAGVASWRAGFESDSIWGVLKKNLNKV